MSLVGFPPQEGKVVRRAAPPQWICIARTHVQSSKFRSRGRTREGTALVAELPLSRWGANAGEQHR